MFALALVLTQALAMVPGPGLFPIRGHWLLALALALALTLAVTQALALVPGPGLDPTRGTSLLALALVFTLALVLTQALALVPGPGLDLPVALRCWPWHWCLHWPWF